MNHHDRMLATIQGKPTDQIPWAPRMDLWYVAQRARGSLPDAFAGLNSVEIAEMMGVSCHAMGADYSRPGRGETSLRGFGQDNHRDFPYRVELRDMPVETDDDPENMRTRIRTPAGEVFTHLHRTRQMAMDGISLPFYKSHAIHSVDDFEKVAQIFEHLEVIPTPEGYRDFQQYIGDRGIAVARGSVGASPIHLMLHELIAMDQFFYLLQDEPRAMHELAERMTPFFEAILDALLASDAEVIFWGANYDQDLTWPSFFEAEIAAWLRKVSDRAHAAGKFLLTHTDGENKDLLPYYPACGIDVADSVCPAPMTKCTLEELRTGMGPTTTIWGGIPSISLLDNSMSDAVFDAYLDDVFAVLGTGDHLILGVSDNVPPDVNMGRLEEIKRRVESFGPVGASSIAT
ncbi:MAG: uroporphyrinogen decarboxylase family protein [Pseudomonadales bacterium]|mgnify:FL=1|jgi:hypothetical protein|nr:uroporphyrinogen decarboxylase family protein [Pseudomonadales bacterium]HJN52695.1 uroporphyrinogen decarboxylase family protein [Pseudomonadales bacterium]|tara:strand:- start:1907 stop:3112 length:1206 start_codon:yes stop_codon:yes gene_type:complete